jgi:hypothetical protein
MIELILKIKMMLKFNWYLDYNWKKKVSNIKKRLRGLYKKRERESIFKWDYKKKKSFF